MEEFFSSFLRRAGMPASAGLSCYYFLRFVCTCLFNFRSHCRSGLATLPSVGAVP